CLAQAVAAVVGGQPEAVEPLLAAAEHAAAATGEEPHQPSVVRAVSVLATLPASIAFLRAEVARLRGDPGRAVAFDQQALEHLVEGDWLLGSHAARNLGGGRWAAGEGYLAVRVGCDLGQVQRARDHLDAALATYRQGLETAAEAGHQLPHLGMAHVGLAEALYERDELLAAHEHATRGVGLCQQLAFTQPLAPGLGMLARIRQAQGDPAGALEAIGQAQRIELSPQVVALHNP